MFWRAICALILFLPIRSSVAEVRQQSCVDEGYCWDTVSEVKLPGRCVPCVPLKLSHRDGLKKLFSRWGYSNQVDSNVDGIQCPSGNINARHITCNADGDIIYITMGNVYLYGDVADVCLIQSVFPTLTTFVISANFLFGTVPSCVSSMTRVEQFFIDHNFYEASSPIFLHCKV